MASCKIKSKVCLIAELTHEASIYQFAPAAYNQIRRSTRALISNNG